MTSGSSPNAWIHADENADKVESEGVSQEICEVGVFAWWSIARGRAFLLVW